MTLLNDSSVALSLGQLNKNITKVGKSLAKLSTGQRITGASVDSASFAISEKMREQIRSLEQDIQNVQNGSSMLKTAHGGIENIVEELRSLKELAIDAANDSNTDADRAIIQKEFDSRRATIDEIASWTNYNTKPLLDGGYARSARSVVSAADGGTSEVFMDTVTDLFSLPKTIMRGKIADTVKWVNGLEAYGRIPVEERVYDESDDSNSYTTQEKWTTMDFSKARNISGGSASVSDMNKQGFSILCSDYLWCPSFHGFVFDSTMSIGTAKKSMITSGPVYFIGIKGAESTADLAGAVYNGLSNLISAHTVDDSDTSAEAKKERANYPEYISEDGTVCLEGYGDAVDIRASGDGYELRQHYPMWIYEGYDLTAAYKELPTDVNTIEGKPLTIHHGAKANQATNFFINDMHTKSLKNKVPSEKDSTDLEALSSDYEKWSAHMAMLLEAKGKTLDDTSVRTKHDANVAIRVIDGAIEYALNEATYVGSYLQRLEYTESNVVTTEENIQGAESTIRDADMAKEMTEYTKNNVLSQAAQSMLAQANQNMSSVLSLLQ